MRPIESRRVALNRRIVLRFPDFDGFVTEYAANLSMTGMFVRSREPQDAGTPVSFELRLESGAPLVRGKGWVVWSRSEREGADRPAGMGVEFTELDHKSRRLVRWMILNQLPEDQGPLRRSHRDRHRPYHRTTGEPVGGSSEPAGRRSDGDRDFGRTGRRCVLGRIQSKRPRGPIRCRQGGRGRRRAKCDGVDLRSGGSRRGDGRRRR